MRSIRAVNTSLNVINVLMKAKPMNLRPYAAAEGYTHWIIYSGYSEQHGIFACNGILFNRESPGRGETFCETQDYEGFSLDSSPKARIL